MPFDKKKWTKEYGKEYRKKNKEKLKQYREKNKEKTKQYQKENIEKIREYKRKYKASPAGRKADTIYSWKRIGLVCDNYCELYDKYLLAEYCDICNKKFNDRFDRCMDHDHETGLFRQFLCRSCNNHDKWKKYL